MLPRVNTIAAKVPHHSPLEEGPAALAGVGVSPELAATLGPPGANLAGLVLVVTPLPPPGSMASSAPVN